MRRLNLFAGVVVITFVTASAVLGQSQEFESLIAADSMMGWRGDVQSWRVENGVLLGSADGTLRANRFIVADIPPVKNFELLADVWISPGGNSGLQYRSEERPDLGPFVVTGYQCDVVSNNDKYNGMLYEERGRRILSHTGEKVVIDTAGQPWIVENMPVQHFAPGEWHRFRVLVEGNRHRHWIDDVPTADLIDLDEQKRSLSGVIGVQVHVGPKMEVRYRNMQLRRLPDDLPLLTASDQQASIPADAPKVEPQGGWKQAGMFDLNARLQAVKPGDADGVFRAGDIWLSGQPSQNTLKQLPDMGIHTVVSFRKPEELDWDEQQLVESLGMKFVRIPFKEADELSDQLLQLALQQIRKNESGQGIFLHCSSGNRAATVWLVHRVMHGRMAVEQACDEAATVGLNKPGFEEAAIRYLKRQKKL